MTVEIWMGSKLVRTIRAKQTQWSLNGMCVMITDEYGNTVEVSANNIIIIHDREEGGESDDRN